MSFPRAFARTLFLAAAIVMPAIARAADPLVASLSFQPDTIPTGATSMMVLEITNPNPIAATGLAASDFYPGGIFNASPASATTTCGGTVTAAAGDHFFFFSGGSLAASSTCVIAVDVTGFGGLWVNAIDPGTVTSTSVPANNFFSTALLIFTDPPPPPPPSAPNMTMAFTPSSIHAGKTSTLSIVLKNPNAAAFSGVSFTAEYPEALINTPSGAMSSCGGTVIAKPGSRTLAFSGGTVPGRGTCSVDVIIRGSSPGAHTVALSAGASATLTVSSSR